MQIRAVFSYGVDRPMLDKQQRIRYLLIDTLTLQASLQGPRQADSFAVRDRITLSCFSGILTALT